MFRTRVKFRMWNGIINSKFSFKNCEQIQYEASSNKRGTAQHRNSKHQYIRCRIRLHPIHPHRSPRCWIRLHPIHPPPFFWPSVWPQQRASQQGDPARRNSSYTLLLRCHSQLRSPSSPAVTPSSTGAGAQRGGASFRAGRLGFISSLGNKTLWWFFLKGLCYRRCFNCSEKRNANLLSLN
jgi:hypothetical protein